MRKDGISVKKYPTLDAHTFRIQIKLKFYKFHCNQSGRYGNK